MHLFFDTVWKLHIGEIPEKPDFEKLKNNPVFKDYKFYTGYKNEDIQQQHDDEIAAIKQNALTVGNPELIPKVIDMDLEETKELLWNCKIAFWPGGYKTKETDKVIDFEGSECYPIYETVAILTLPEEKKNTMENMTKEPEPREVLFKYPQLRHLEIKVGSLEMAAIECAMREYAIEFQKFSLYKDHPTTASGSVAALCPTCGSDWGNSDMYCSNEWHLATPAIQKQIASLRQQLKEREEALKELLPIAESGKAYHTNAKAIIERARKTLNP